MELKYTTKGTPYLTIDDKNMIVFSSCTATERGYDRVVFSGVTTSEVATSAGKGKSKVKSRKVVEERTSISSDLATFGDLYKIAKGKGCILTKSSVDGIRKIITPYLVSGIFPFDKVDKLAADVENLDKVTPEDLLDEDPNGYWEDEEDVD